MSSTLAAQTKINKDVPYGLTVAAAWSWRLVAVVIGIGVVVYLLGFVSLVVIPILVAAQQAVAGVAARGFGDVQALLDAVQDPAGAGDAVRPGAHLDAVGGGRDHVRAVRLGEVHAGHAVPAQGTGQADDDGLRGPAVQAVLGAGGVRSPEGGQVAGLGHGTS